ncbi:aromatic acid exporter family protein [Pseudonocardia sp. NPDC049154]|uniref:FUSC family protein n=1 Tax=Pseudonocardia sp. NPDC049154 TaxID=3155501 RepID=UPI0033CA81EB
MVEDATQALRRFGGELTRRVRERGRSALFRAGRITGASVAAFLVAQLLGLRYPPPLIAALTAVLVVQATLASTLVNGVQRVLSVVSGVALAVLFVSFVGLTWWSLGALVATSIVVGQILRLGPHLVEVPISAMLVLGVGFAAGAEVTGAGRALETLIGAAVGVSVNVVFPPAVQTRNAGLAIERFANGIADLLEEAAAKLAAGPVDAETTARWLDDARRLNRHAPQVDRALAHAEESRRLNVRALGTRRLGSSPREAVDTLEHASVSVRTLFRAVHDATREHTGVREDVAYTEEVRLATSALMDALAAVARSYGLLTRRGIESRAAPDDTALHDALDALGKRRTEAADLLLTDPRGRDVLWGLNTALLTTVDRVLQEIAPAG